MDSQSALSGKEFQRRVRNLVILAWMVPPVFGLSFLLYLQIFTMDQMVGVMTSLPKPAFLVTFLVFAVTYFSRFLRPIAEYLDKPNEQKAKKALQRARAFSFRFWGIFLIYLLAAPVVMIFSAEYFTDFVATSVDWFRINLV
ncbi:MAG: hypothetical protein V3R49_02475, partial [Gammaproteobacteria bacterium]